MSHFTTLTTQLTNTGALVAALADLGFEDVEVHENAQPLYGYQGDQRRDRAHVIVRRRHIGTGSNDIGFHRRPDGRFDAVISDYDRARYNKAWLGKVTARHAYYVTSVTLADQGFDLVEERTERDGTVRMVLRRVS